MAVSLDGLHPTFMRPRVEALLADPEASALGVYVVSAFRSIDKQRVLFEDAMKRYGSTTAAAKWVAPPGKSNHGPTLDDAGHKVADQAKDGRWGSAVDLGVPGYTAVSGQWPAELETKVNIIAARHGLASPMDWEDWHFEPIPNWAPAPQEDDDMRPVAGCPSWTKRQANGAFPRFVAHPEPLIGGCSVESVNNAGNFAPVGFHAGKHDGVEDYVQGGNWCRRFFGCGAPLEFGETADGSFFLITENGTYDVQKKPA